MSDTQPRAGAVAHPADDRTGAYARAMLDVARAEGRLDAVSDELFRFARALDGSDDLRSALADPHLPVSRRQQVVEDLLGDRADATTIAIISMAVAAGRARDLPRYIDLMVEMAAEEKRRAVAQVRSAVELTEDQRQRLAAALERATGKSVEVKVVLDPTVLGGIVTTIGDTVIDGSIRTRLDQLKNAF